MHTCKQERHCQLAAHRKNQRTPHLRGHPSLRKLFGLVFIQKRQNLSSVDAR